MNYFTLKKYIFIQIILFVKKARVGKKAQIGAETMEAMPTLIIISQSMAI